MTTGHGALDGAALQQDPDSLTIYYDGLCPLCMAEINLLTARNRLGLLNFIDVSRKDFTDASHAVSCADAMAQMRGLLGSGQLLTGIPVFTEAYRRADLPFLAWLFSRRWTRPLLDVAYAWFARYRHAISRVLGTPLLRLSRWWTSGCKHHRVC
jgi:predicted DCC family thiol-disulfide oxidoreductase YuxK